MKKDYSISRQQQDDLIKAYNKVAPLSWTQQEAYMNAVKQPAPRYYITARQAAFVISKMVKGDFERVDMMQPNRRRMYYSLFERVNELSEKRDFVGKPLGYIMQFAVISPAPEFFVGHEKVREVRKFIKNGHYTEDGRVVNHKGREDNYRRLKEKRAMLKAYREQRKAMRASESGLGGQ